MKAVFFTGERTVEVTDHPDPTPGPGEVVVEIKASGMCGSDLHSYRGPRKDKLYVAGHEPAGVIAEVGQGVNPNIAKVGDRVLVHTNDGCMTCKHCLEGWPQLCLEQPVFYATTRDGSHAQFMLANDYNIVKLPEGMTFKTAAAVACGTTTAYGAIKRLKLHGEETLAVFGQGPVGLSGTLLGKALGARVIALDISAERRALALKFGADEVIDPLNDDPVEAIRDLTHGEGAHKAMECSSNIDARRQSVECLRAWGTSCLVGVYGDISMDTRPILFRNLHLIGTMMFSHNMLAECAELVNDRKLDVESLFTHEFALAQADEAYAMFDQQKMGKGIFLL